MKFLTVTGLILSLGLSSFAMAGHHGDMKKDHFKGMDMDGDQSVSMEEFMKKHEKKFKKMDADGSGAVSHEEYSNYKSMKKDKKEKKGSY